MKWFLPLWVCLVISGCAQTPPTPKSVEESIKDTLPPNEWVIVEVNERQFMALKETGRRDVLWVIIDSQSRTLAIACRDEYADAIQEICEKLLTKQTLQPGVADALYHDALMHILGLKPESEPSTVTGTGHTPASLDL